MKWPFVNASSTAPDTEPEEKEPGSGWKVVTGTAPFIAARCGSKVLMLCQELATPRNFLLIDKINRSFERNFTNFTTETWSEEERDELNELLYDVRLWDLL